MKIRHITALCLFVIGLATVQGCAGLDPKHAGEALKSLALEVCVSGETLEVCARKCAEACELKELKK